MRGRNRCGAVELSALWRDAEGAAGRSESGWAELPGRKDMAKLQFGDSFCQIEGLYVPVADVNLAGSDSIYFTHHVLLWKDPQVNITTMPLASGWKRMFAGLPLIMTQAHGPGHIAFSRDAPGEMIALPLQPGEEVDVREHLFMLATSNVAYDWFSTNVWYTTQSGDDKETHYPVGMFMDRFSAPQAPGLLLLHASGNVFVRELAPGQTILVKPTALIFKDPSVQMQLHFEHPPHGLQLCGAIGAIDIIGCDCGGRGASPSSRFSIAWKARTAICRTAPRRPSSVGRRKQWLMLEASRLVCASSGTGRFARRQVRGRSFATRRMGSLGGRSVALSDFVLARRNHPRASRRGRGEA